MNFRFETKISEQDYINFNKFHTLKTESGKKAKKKLKIVLLALILLIILFFFVFGGLKCGIIGGSIFLLAYIITFFRTDKILLSTTEKTIKDLKKTGKLPYTPCSTLEFNEETYIESNEDERIERKYSVIENIYTSEEYMAVYIFTSSITAVLLPYSAFESRKELSDFLEFMKTKCPKVIYS